MILPVQMTKADYGWKGTEVHTAPGSSSFNTVNCLNDLSIYASLLSTKDSRMLVNYYYYRFRKSSLIFPSNEHVYNCFSFEKRSLGIKTAKFTNKNNMIDN